LVKFRFRWFAKINFKDTAFQKVLRLMGPRLVSMGFIQLIFLARDNLASRLPVGSVTALSYGWWIQQVPETLIGTAIATALLPTLSEHIASEDHGRFKDTIERSLKVMIALSLPITVILSLASLPLIQFAFGFSIEDAQMILWASQGYLVGLLGHSLVELGVRSFYARQNARVPMMVSGLGLLFYISLAVALISPLGAGGIALANSLSYSIQGVLLFVLLNRKLPQKFNLGSTFLRSLLSGIGAGLAVWLMLSVLPIPLSPLILSIVSMGVGGLIGAIPIWPEIRSLVNL
jgi:putative peptidoglycan lipid II flippase